MSNLRRIDSMLKNQDFAETQNPDRTVFDYARAIAEIENSIVVVSDLKYGVSRIFAGEFAKVLGLENYGVENSIWEKEILNLMDGQEREAKYLAEMRFFNFMRMQPRRCRPRHYLFTRLRLRTRSGAMIDVAHRMYYRYEDSRFDTIRYGICIYGPLAGRCSSRCSVINALSGEVRPMDGDSDSRILSRREKQVLQFIERGMTSEMIASELSISRHTVNRHRQDILSRLRVRNSTEACRLARQLNII